MKKFKGLFVNNWGLKLISLSIAFALWFVVISINDPVDDKTFQNIKVNLVHTEVLTDKGKVYEVLEGTNQLRSISFEAPKSIREKIEAGDIIAEADFNEMTSTDTVPIRFSCPKYGNNVTDISGNISYVKLRVEEKTSKWIDIKYKLIGEVAEGYVVSENNVTLDQNRLEITGPASKVAEVARAVVEVNVKDISNNISVRSNVQLRNADGGKVNYDSIKQSINDVKVEVVVFATKTVPVEYQVMGEPEKGYMLTGEIDTTPESVVIAGPTLMLNNTNALVVPAEELDITGATENFVKDINLRKFLTGGIVFADKAFDGKAKVTVYVEKIAELELDITQLNLQITNKPMNKLVEYKADAEIPKLRIEGLDRYVSAVNADSVRGIIDVQAWMNEQQMEDLPSGTYQLPVAFVLNSKIKQVEPVMVTLEVMTPEEFADRAKYNQQ